MTKNQKNSCYYCKGTGKDNGSECIMCGGRGFTVETNEKEPLICPHCGHDCETPYEYFDNPPEDEEENDWKCGNCGKEFSSMCDVTRSYSFKTFPKE